MKIPLCGGAIDRLRQFLFGFLGYRFSPTMPTRKPIVFGLVRLYLFFINARFFRFKNDFLDKL